MSLLVVAMSYAQSDIASICSDSDKIEYAQGKYVKGVNNERLVDKATINGKEDISYELMNLIIEEFKGETGLPQFEKVKLTIKIDVNGNVELHNSGYLITQLASFQSQLKNMSEEHKKTMHKVMGIMTEEDNDKLIALVNRQNWKPGKCLGKKVNSILSFEILFN